MATVVVLNERFFSKTVEVPAPVGYDLSTPCRLWTGGTVTNSRGEKYGKLEYAGKTVLAHRLAAAARAGMTLEEMMAAKELYVLHGCDRTRCVCHGRFGTPSENLQEAYDRGRRQKEA